MPFDPLTVTASAIVSALVSIGTASWKLGREDRVNRALAARNRIRDATKEVLDVALAREADPTEAVIETAPGLSAFWRYTFASRVMVAVDDPGPVRRRLVMRRVRKLVGPAVADAALLAPAREGAPADDLLIKMMLKQRLPDDGTLSLLKTNSATPKELRRLVRSLKEPRNAR